MSNITRQRNQRLMKKRMERLVENIVKNKREHDQRRELALHRAQARRRKRLKHFQHISAEAQERLAETKQEFRDVPLRPHHTQQSSDDVARRHATTKRLFSTKRDSLSRRGRGQRANPEAATHAFYRYLQHSNALPPEPPRRLPQTGASSPVTRSQIMKGLMEHAHGLRTQPEVDFVVRRLRKVRLLAPLSVSKLQSLAQRVTYASYQRNDRLWRQGDPCDELTLIVGGTITVETRQRRRGGNGERGHGKNGGRHGAGQRSHPDMSVTRATGRGARQLFGAGRRLDVDIWSMGRKPLNQLSESPLMSAGASIKHMGRYGDDSASVGASETKARKNVSEETFHEGSHFAEHALVGPYSRQGTAVASELTEVLALRRSDFTTVMHEADASMVESRCWQLKKVGLFHGMLWEDLKQVAALVTEATFSRGDTILQAGTTSGHIYFIVQGECREVATAASRAATAATSSSSSSGNARGSAHGGSSSKPGTAAGGQQRRLGYRELVPVYRPRVDDEEEEPLEEEEDAEPVLIGRNLGQEQKPFAGFCSGTLMRRQVSVLATNEYFGDVSCLLGVPNETDIVAHTDVLLLMISKASFRTKLSHALNASALTNARRRAKLRQEGISTTSDVLEQVQSLSTSIVPMSAKVRLARASKAVAPSALRSRPATAPDPHAGGGGGAGAGPPSPSQLLPLRGSANAGGSAEVGVGGGLPPARPRGMLPSLSTMSSTRSLGDLVGWERRSAGRGSVTVPTTPASAASIGVTWGVDIAQVPNPPSPTKGPSKYAMPDPDKALVPGAEAVVSSADIANPEDAKRHMALPVQQPQSVEALNVNDSFAHANERQRPKTPTLGMLYGAAIGGAAGKAPVPPADAADGNGGGSGGVDDDAGPGDAAAPATSRPASPVRAASRGGSPAAVDDAAVWEEYQRTLGHPPQRPKSRGGSTLPLTDYDFVAGRKLTPRWVRQERYAAAERERRDAAHRIQKMVRRRLAVATMRAVRTKRQREELRQRYASPSMQEHKAATQVQRLARGRSARHVVRQRKADIMAATPVDGEEAALEQELGAISTRLERTTKTPRQQALRRRRRQPAAPRVVPKSPVQLELTTVKLGPRKPVGNAASVGAGAGAGAGAGTGGDSPSAADVAAMGQNSPPRLVNSSDPEQIVVHDLADLDARLSVVRLRQQHRLLGGRATPEDPGSASARAGGVFSPKSTTSGSSRPGGEGAGFSDTHAATAPAPATVAVAVAERDDAALAAEAAAANVEAAADEEPLALVGNAAGLHAATPTKGKQVVE